MTLKVGMRYCG